MSKTYEHQCPDCKRTMSVEDRGDGLLRITLPAPPPPAKCCEKSASGGYKVTAAFTTPGK